MSVISGHKRSTSRFAAKTWPFGCTLALVIGLAEISRAAPAGSDPPGAIDVVLDPGHGGSNSGSPGRGEVLEKHVTLALAKAVRVRLESVGIVVQMTRTRDAYVPIRARARTSNVLRPHCFVSIHTNASPDHSRSGVETYLLSREQVDIHARHAARMASSDAEAVLADLRALEIARRSLRLAESLQHQFVGVGGAAAASDRGYHPTDRGVRQAAHDVLADAEGPSVLIEAGFLDHPTEGRVLASAAGQAHVADRIAAGIIGFLHGERSASPGARLDVADEALARLAAK